MILGITIHHYVNIHKPGKLFIILSRNYQHKNATIANINMFLIMPLLIVLRASGLHSKEG